MANIAFSNIGLHGFSVGSLNFMESTFEWKDRSRSIVKQYTKEELDGARWTVFGSKGYLKFLFGDGRVIQMDGFARSDLDRLSQFIQAQYGIRIENEEVSSDGSHFGAATFDKKSIVVSSVHGKPIFDISLEHVSMCVVPQLNRDDVEIQFHEPEHIDREEDALAQFTLHFPGGDPEESQAEAFKRDVMDAGVVRAVAGDVIVEFNKEQGNFVTPRGKYTIQMMMQHFHIQGAQYSHTIKYTDICGLYLLPKPDGGRTAFVISLESEIRQGNQKYQHLVIESHNLDSTVTVNLTEEEIQSNFPGELEPVMKKPLSALLAKVFKVFTHPFKQVTVLMPKHFFANKGRDVRCVRCSLKASEGLLYPMAKFFIFIHKPTVVIKFSDIETIKFDRLEAGQSSTRSFDLKISLRSGVSMEAKEYTFSSIDKSEKSALYDYIESKGIEIIDTSGGNTRAGPDLEDEDDGGGDFGSDDESEDDDYEGGSQSDEDDDDDDGSGSGSDQSGGGGGSGDERLSKAVKSKKRSSEERERGSGKKGKQGKTAKGDSGKKKQKKEKDKDAPKAAKTAFFAFSSAMRQQVKDENPGISVTEVAKEMGLRWKNLSAEEKEPYEAEARQDKERHTRESEIYKRSKADS